MNKFTFKKGAKERGLAAIGNPYPQTTIKLNGKVVGFIQPPSGGASLNYEPNWRVWVRKQDTTNPNCNWKNVRLKAAFTEESFARTWILDNADRIVAIGLVPEN